MIRGWAAGRVGLQVAILCEEAKAIQATQGETLDGDQVCAVLQDVSALVVDLLLPHDATPPRIMIAHLDS